MVHSLTDLRVIDAATRLEIAAVAAPSLAA
jgi:hypothetical protein